MDDWKYGEVGRRLFSNSIATTSGCLEWAGGLRGKNGYGCTSVDNRTVSTHRLAYELVKGPIPPGLEIDHLCRNRRCMNPDHLEAVTTSVNNRRGLSPSLLSQRQRQHYQSRTHCKWGHPFSPENTLLRPHHQHAQYTVRICRECNKLRQRPDWQKV